MNPFRSGNGAVTHASLPALPARDAEGHKGTFGTVGVIGGQTAPPRVMIGGPAFTALAALRAGAGLAVLAVPAPATQHALTIVPSATGLALPVDAHGAISPSAAAEVIDKWINSFSCLAIGPGFGVDEPQQQVVARLIARDDIPMVLDADALNCMAAMREFRHDLKAQTVLTPHPGEFDRLARALGIEPLEGRAGDHEKRRIAAERLAQSLGVIVVLKGAGTVVSNGIESWRNPTGSAALATAGSGDVLTGVIAGLIAQFASAANSATTMSLYDCARWGVYLHGLAADMWTALRGSTGMLASDLVALIPDAIERARMDP